MSEEVDGTIRDTRMAARALEERWPLTPEVRRAVIAKLTKIVIDPNAKRREVIAAARGLMYADKINIAGDAVAKMPDQSEGAINEQFARAGRILDRFADRIAESRGTDGASGGCVDGAVRSRSEDGG